MDSRPQAASDCTLLARMVPAWGISLLGAAIYAVWVWLLARASGPAWVLLPNDLGYNYLFNGLNLINGEPLGTLIHPATTVSFVFAACVRLIHAVVGGDDLVRSVVANAEQYMRIIESAIVLANAAALFLVGQCLFASTGRRVLIPVVQGSFVLCSPIYQAYDSLGTPESLQTLFTALLVVVSLVLARDQRHGPSSRTAAIVTSGVLVGAAIGCKFTAAPIFILPFVMMQDRRERTLLAVSAAISVLLFLSPVMMPANRGQFVGDLLSLLSSARSERQAADSGSLSAAVLAQIQTLYHTMPVFFWLLEMEIAGLFVIPIFGDLQRRHLTGVYRVYAASVLTLVAAVGLTLLRPKANYLGPYTSVLALAAALGLYVAGRVAATLGRWLRSLRYFVDAAAAAVVVVYIATIYTEVTNQRSEFALLHRLRDDAFTLNERMAGLGENEALMTAIPSSNVSTAFDHANGTSRYANAWATAEIVPANHYRYLMDGVRVADRATFLHTLQDIKSRYQHLYYWSVASNFRPDEWRRPPDAIMRTLFDGQVERLAEVEAIAISRPFDPARSHVENDALGWTDAPCGASCRSVTLALPDMRDEAVTYYRMWADDIARARLMPSRWQVEASSDGLDWSALDSVEDLKPWAPGEVRTYSVRNDRSYRFYRLVAAEASAELWPAHVKLYSAGANLAGLFPFRAAWLAADSLSIVLARDPSSAQANPYWSAVSDRARHVRSYILSAGSTEAGAARMPVHWVLQGSVDGRIWQELDGRSDDRTWVRGEQRNYRIAQPGTYRYFRLQSESSAAGSVQIESVRVIGPDDPQAPLERLPVQQGEFWEHRGPFPIGIEFDLTHQMKAEGYALASGPYGADSTERMPIDWELWGTADGSNWVLLDSRADQGGWRMNEERLFRIAKPDSYGKYRFVFLATNSPFLRIQGIKLLGPTGIAAGRE